MSDNSSAIVRSHVEASPERVWHALTDGEALTAWYWPAAVRPVAISDPVVGGRFGLAADGMGFSGDYVELDPPRRIVQTWRWAGDERDTLVTIELTASDGGTDLLVRHDVADAATADMYRAGWQSCLDRLPGYLTSAGNR